MDAWKRVETRMVLKERIIALCCSSRNSSKAHTFVGLTDNLCPSIAVPVDLLLLWAMKVGSMEL